MIHIWRHCECVGQSLPALISPRYAPLSKSSSVPASSVFLICVSNASFVRKLEGGIESSFGCLATWQVDDHFTSGFPRSQDHRILLKRISVIFFRQMSCFSEPLARQQHRKSQSTTVKKRSQSAGKKHANSPGGAPSCSKSAFVASLSRNNKRAGTVLVA